jgi:hypothetical protein
MTLHNRRAQIIDNIFTGTAFLNMMRARGGVEIEPTGGVGIVRGVRFAKNSTAASFSGFDTFVISPQDNETSLNYPWSSLWVHVSIAWDEERRNSGQARLINLVNQKIDDAEMALRDELNIQLLQDQPAAGSKDLNGIEELIDETPAGDPTRGTAPLGGISGAAAAWWRPQADVSGAAFGVGAMNTMYNDASDGSDFPTFVLSTQASYEAYEADQVDQIRYGAADALDASFSSLLFKQVPLVWDPSVTLANSMYFINTNYTKLVIHEEGQFVTSDFIEPDNGASKTAKILLMAQLITTNRRRNGVYTHT